MSINTDPFNLLEELRGRAISGGRQPLASRWTPTGEGTTFWSTSTCGRPAGTIDVTAENQVLSVSAERRFEEHQGDEFLVSVRPQGRFSRQFRLGSTIDTENIGASYDDGVLTLTLPVSERARPRQIQVGRGGGQGQIGEGGS